LNSSEQCDADQPSLYSFYILNTSITTKLKQGSVSGNLNIIWHPEPDVIATVTSTNNVKVRLTSERWLHIAEYHRELVNFQLEILLTIGQPDKLYHSPAGTEPNFAAVKVFDRLVDYGLQNQPLIMRNS
jgi:hypothetical protein